MPQHVQLQAHLASLPGMLATAVRLGSTTPCLPTQAHRAPCAALPSVRCSSCAGSPGSQLPQFAESQLPRFAAPPVASTSQSRTRPFQEKVHIDKCAPPEGESSRNIRYTVVIAAAQRVLQSFCSPGSASPPPVSMRASCADSKLTPATGSSRSVLLVVQRKHPGGHGLTGGIAYLFPWI